MPILASELKPLRVNGVAPGMIDMPWWDTMPAEQKQPMFASLGGKILIGRVGAADAVAKAIAVLINDSFVIGHLLTVDGGLRFSA